MKNFIAKRLALPLALSGAVLPLILVGCGGSNGVGPAKTQSTTAPTTGPVTPSPIALTPTTFTLQNGQRVTLSGTRTGTALSGTLRVLNAAAQSRSASGSQNATFPFSVSVGEYGYTGTFTPPRGFDIVGKFGGLGDFTMSGQLQTATEDGSYSITTGGVTDTGVLPASGTTPVPTTPPPTGNYKLSGSLAVSSVTASSPVVTSPFNTFNYTPNEATLITTNLPASLGGGSIQNLSFGASDQNLSGPGTRRDIAVALPSATSLLASDKGPFTVNQTIELGQNLASVIQYSQATVVGTSIKFTIWRAVSGDAIVRAIGTNSATVELKNVRMRGLNVSGETDAAAGEFTFNGTLAATGLTAKTQ